MSREICHVSRAELSAECMKVRYLAQALGEFLVNVEDLSQSAELAEKISAAADMLSNDLRMLNREEVAMHGLKKHQEIFDPNPIVVEPVKQEGIMKPMGPAPWPSRASLTVEHQDGTVDEDQPSKSKINKDNIEQYLGVYGC